MSHKNQPSISVIIPVKNEGQKIQACIDGILNQTIKVKEIIVIDSGSTDKTIEILKDYPIVKLIEIPPAEFNHGATRNLGIHHALGEFILCTVGDARAYDEFWIEGLVKYFDTEKVAGVCGFQAVPHEMDKNPIEWFRPQSEPSIRRHQFSTPQDFYKLSPEKRKQACGWDNVTAMYRKSVMIEIPFRKTVYGEDPQWALDALLSGYELVYNPGARVYHYHLETPEYTYLRTITTLYHRYKFFDFIPKTHSTSLKIKLSWLKTLFKTKEIGWLERWKWFQYNSAVSNSSTKAVNQFLEVFAKGEKALDEFHSKVCNKPPIPSKAKLN